MEFAHLFVRRAEGAGCVDKNLLTKSPGKAALGRVFRDAAVACIMIGWFFRGALALRGGSRVVFCSGCGCGIVEQ